MDIKELRKQFINAEISKSDSDGWYQQFVKIPTELDPEEILNKINVKGAYLDENDNDEYFIERAWETFGCIPASLRKLVKK